MIAILIVAGIAVTGVLASFIFRTRFRVVITPTPGAVVQYQPATFKMTMEQKNGLWAYWLPVPGTFIIRAGPTGILGALPLRGGTNEAALDFAVTVMGTKPGTDYLRISGTPAGETKAIILDVPINVTPENGGTGRFRQTAQALIASVRV